MSLIIKTLKVNEFTNQNAHSGWMDKKNKTLLYAAYKRPISALKTYVG